ncbi:MAG TPA: T9SS type A sorting domain-containing protein [bacterium]|nr:T9SS type A sorting domain-containing protein [bacterium]
MDSADVVFKNNVVLNTNSGFQIGINLTFSDAVIRNNSFILKGSMGSFIICSMSNPIISSNILYGQGTGLTGIQNRYGHPQISYNDLFIDDTPYQDCEPSIGDIQADPLFMNIDRGDFRLSENSPCIDTGNPDPQFNDLDGSRNDMGAFGGTLADTTGFLSRQIEVNFAETTLRTGDTLIIPIHADDLKDIAQFELEIIYDNLQLMILTVKRTQLSHPFILSITQSSAGITQVNFSSQNSIDQKSGFICELVAAINSSDDSVTTVALTNLLFIDKLENRYQIAPIERDFIISAVKDKSTAGDIKINKFMLHQNYPNPFNPNTTIKFHIDQPVRTSLIIYNLLGQQVRKLLDKNLPPGEYSLHWDGKNDGGQSLSSGLYFARLASGGRSELIKLVLVR